MLSKATKMALFVSAYSPLFAILGIRLIPSLASYVLWGITLMSIIFSVTFFSWVTRNIAPYHLECQNLVGSQGEVIAFVVTYIIPFLAFNKDAWQDWAAVGLLLVVIAILYVNSPLIHTNPLLALFGWRTYELTTTAGQRILLTRKMHAPGYQSLKVVALGDNIVLEVN
jgi:hypothetical protein